MSTLAHSTVVVDGKNQAFTWCHDHPEKERSEAGRCHAHLFRDDVSACTVSADFAYPGCSLKRTLFLTSRYLLDIMECDATDGREHVYDWLLHTTGVLQSDLPFVGAVLACENKGVVTRPADRPYSPGAMMPVCYDYVREVMSLDTPNDWSMDVMSARWAADVWRIQGKAMRLWMLGQSGTNVFKGVCPAAARDVYHPVLLVRRHTRRTVFVALHVPGEAALKLDCLVNENGTIACQVTGGDCPPDIHVKQDQDRATLIQGKAFKGRLDSTLAHLQ
jgi:hypothetical protein